MTLRLQRRFADRPVAVRTDMVSPPQKGPMSIDRWRHKALRLCANDEIMLPIMRVRQR